MPHFLVFPYIEKRVWPLSPMLHFFIIERLGNIKPGTKFKYKCKGQKPMGFFICDRNDDGKHKMRHCTDNTAQCKTFDDTIIEPADFNFGC